MTEEKDVECAQTELLKVYVKSQGVPLSFYKKRKISLTLWESEGKISLNGLLDVREYYSILL